MEVVPNYGELPFRATGKNLSAESQKPVINGSRKTLLRRLPSVSHLLEEAANTPLLDFYGAELTTEAMRSVLAQARQEILNSEIFDTEGDSYSTSALLTCRSLMDEGA